MSKKFEGMRQQQNSQYLQFQKQLNDQGSLFKSDILAVREEMVTKIDHSALESRVKALESGGLAAPQVSWLQQQVQRLDPANRSLCFKNLKQTNPATRKTVIEDLLEGISPMSVV